MRGLIAFFMAAAAVQPLHAQALQPSAETRMHELLVQLEELAMFNGHVIVDQGGTTAFDRSYGYASYEHRVPLNRNTRFAIASLSKVFTDAAVAQLISQGKLSVDTPVAELLPSYPRGREITVGHLLSHRSGIAHSNDQGWGDDVSLSLDEIVSRLASLPLDFAPGEKRSYSNGGYAVLAKMLEVATGESYDQLMERLVFGPLELQDTGVISDYRASIDRMATGYEPGPTIGSRRRSRPYAYESRPGGGSLYSTPRDLHKFFAAIWRGDFPDEHANRVVFGDRGKTRYADGRSPGYYMDVRFEPAHDLLVLSVANNYAAEFRWAENLALMAQGAPPLFEKVPSLAQASPRPSTIALTGVFRNANPGFSQNLAIRIRADGQAFLEDKDGDTASALIPLSDGGWLDPLYWGICRAESQVLKCTRLYEGGFTTELVRLRDLN